MNYEQPDSKVSSAEDRESMIKHDTFKALWEDKIEKLLVDGEYDKIQGEINNELSALARVLGGDQNEQFRKLKEDFVAGLPEEVQLLIDPESPRARARVAREKAERDARIEELLKDKFNKEA